MLTMILSDGKLFNTFPWVLDPNARKPVRAMVRHMSKETPVE